MNLRKFLLAIRAGIFNFSPLLNALKAEIMVAVNDCLFFKEFFHANMALYSLFFDII
jgi:hypothetical protein